MMWSVIADVPRCDGNDSEVFVLKSLEYFYVRVGRQMGLRIAVQQQLIFDRQFCCRANT